MKNEKIKKLFGLNEETVAIFVMIFVAAVLILALFGNASFDALPYLDLGGTEFGWNWISVTFVILMAYHSIVTVKHAYEPFELRKLMLILVAAASTLLFYYTLLDMIPHFIVTNLIYLSQGVNPTPYASWFIIQHLEVNRLPTNIIILLFSAFMVSLFTRKQLDYKWLILTFLATMVINFAEIATYGTYNIRILPTADRIFTYYVLFVPSWFAWLFGYYLTFKKGGAKK